MIINTQPSLIAAKDILATFLNQSTNNITCELLTGGSEEFSLVKCTYLTTTFVIKFFSDSAVGQNEIAWTWIFFTYAI